MSKYILTLILALSMSSMAWANATPDEEYFGDLIHSDVPLWGTGDGVWPQHFMDGDDFGCTNRFAFGDWKQVDYQGEESWRRLTNYGVFHCAVIFNVSDERETLDKAAYEYGYLVELGDIKAEGKVIELWAFQIGMRPGSDYLLLSRPKGSGIIRAFSVLQSKCPRGNIREVSAPSVWLSRYCAINSKSELITLARRMAKLKPLATLEWVETPPQDDE